MESTLNNMQSFFPDGIYKPMLVSDPSAPETREVALEGLRLSYALEWRTNCVSNQVVDSLKHPVVVLLPIEIVFPGIRLPHGINSTCP